MVIQHNHSGVPARHPGRGGRARDVPKGRQIDPAALAEVEALLAGREKRRDLLIEHLHAIQDAHGRISAAHLTALAGLMRLSLAEVFEVASFYAHFDVAGEDGPPPKLVVRVCDSVACSMFGAEALAADLQASVGDAARVVRAPCMGMCDHAPSVQVGHHFVRRAGVAEVLETIAAGDSGPHVPAYVDGAAYRAGGGYRVLEELRRGALSADEVLGVLDDAELRGLGGAGFPIGRKWRAVRGERGPRLMAVNADEGEPGTFKDRHYLNTDPHRFLEGMLIAAQVVEATDAYIYVRDEYPAARAILAAELPKVPEGGPRLHLRRGAGAYICGEESAMLESIEGRRGVPRHKPPFPFQVGLFGRPTLINTVETLYWVRDLLERGAGWWKSFGRNGRYGLRSFSVSGRVGEPGVKLAPAGITVRELIEEYCGGMLPGHSFAAYLPGGASGGILPASLGDVPLDFGTLEQYGSFIGSAAVVVLSDQDDVRAVALNLMRFFADESCGKCTPCRMGTQKASLLMQRPVWDGALLEELARTMRDASICGLGQAAANPLVSVLRHFGGAG